MADFLREALLQVQLQRALRLADAQARISLIFHVKFKERRFDACKY